MVEPEQIHLLATEVAILWSDGRESYYPYNYLRQKSPSADNQGERDLLGKSIAPDRSENVNPDVKILAWEPVGTYAIRFVFSDGHSTGLYPFSLLRDLDPEQK